MKLGYNYRKTLRLLRSIFTLRLPRSQSPLFLPFISYASLPHLLLPGTIHPRWRLSAMREWRMEVPFPSELVSIRPLNPPHLNPVGIGVGLPVVVDEGDVVRLPASLERRRPRRDRSGHWWPGHDRSGHGRSGRWRPGRHRAGHG
jgi:hypothetical protein